MRSISRLVALSLLLLAGCVIDGVDPDYGTLGDVAETTIEAVGGEAVQESWTVECLDEPGRERVAMSIRFPEVTDPDAALDAIWSAWSSLWPDGAEQESDERLFVSTPPGVTAATVLNDPVGEFRVDLVGPCREV